jgi:hypothetical protein
LRLVLESDESVLRRTELLHPKVTEAERREGLTDRVGLKRMGPAQLDHDTAAKIDPEIETGVKEEHHREGAQNRRYDHSGETTPHELDGRAVGNQA